MPRKVESDIRQLREQKQEVKQKQKELQNQLLTLQEKKNSLPLLEERQHSLQQKTQVSVAEKAAIEATLKGLKNQKEELELTLEYSGKEELEKRIDQYTQSMKEIQEEIKKVADAYQKVLREKATLIGRLSTLKVQRESSKEGNLEEEEKRLAGLKEEKRSLQQEYEQVSSRWEKNKDALQNIRSQSRLLEEKQVTYGWMKALNDTANGRQNEKRRKYHW